MKYSIFDLKFAYHDLGSIDDRVTPANQEQLVRGVESATNSYTYIMTCIELKGKTTQLAIIPVKSVINGD